jgi:hypothetical protein
MNVINISEPVPFCSLDQEPSADGEVHIFTQFFIHRDSIRNREIRQCLRLNADNPFVTKIHLLNEKLYSEEELGTTTDKIVQLDIGHRLKFSDVFQYIRKCGVKGYLILTNADIFFDNTINNVKMSKLAFEKMAMVQLRFEYRGDDSIDSPIQNLGVNTCAIFGPRFDSQDTWIFHSNFMISKRQERALGFEFGKPGCDNKLVYLLKIMGFKLYNDPVYLKTYHNHKSDQRDYNSRDMVPRPWGGICPAGYHPFLLPPSIGINMQHIQQANQDIWFEDNDKLYAYVQEKMAAEEVFIIPRIAGVENNTAVFAKLPNMQDRIDSMLPTMKQNAGVKMSNSASIQKYSDMYLKAFENCDMYFGWDVQGNYIGHIAQSHQYIRSTYLTKKMLWSLALDIFHYIHGTPWTHALRGKRILLVSAFEDSIKEKLEIRDKIWGETGVDLFPECTFVTIKPPMTQAEEESKEFDQELAAFFERLDAVKDDYDIALASCGGYGNLVCNYIFENHKKSAIYVGGVLQMYFGILGNRWLEERPDVIRLFLNEYWSRPKEHERPKGCQAIERGCYW